MEYSVVWVEDEDLLQVERHRGAGGLHSRKFQLFYCVHCMIILKYRGQSPKRPALPTSERAVGLCAQVHS